MVKTYRAALWMAGWLVTTLAMTLAGRELATVLPVFVVMIMRSGIALLLLSPIVFLWYRGNPVRTRRLPMHLARNLIHYARAILLVSGAGADPDRAGHRHRVHPSLMDGAARRRLSRREA